MNTANKMNKKGTKVDGRKKWEGIANKVKLNDCDLEHVWVDKLKNWIALRCVALNYGE